MDQAAPWIVGAVLVAALVFFVWGRWRYDLVAIMALLLLAIIGIIPSGEVFSGFSHPAVITVAAILVNTAALRNSGAIDILGARLARMGGNRLVHVIVLCFTVALCSGFMNNVGALAVFMPVAIHIARTNGYQPSYILMPIAFASLLGGMTTLIGTPPNIIIASYRTEVNGQPFALFDFAFVGIGVALAGLVFIVIAGLRFVPLRKGQASAEDLFEIEDYLAELLVPEKSKAIGLTVGEINQAAEADILIIGIARGDRRIVMPSRRQPLRQGDVILVEGDAEAIKTLTDKLQLKLEGDEELRKQLMRTDDIEVVEAFVTPDSYIEGRTAGQLNMRRRFGVNLLGVARQGQRLKQRLRDIRFLAGDVLLFQGDSQAVQEALSVLGCLPLAHRGLKIGKPQKAVTAVGLFALAIAAIALGWATPHVAFATCATAMILARILTLREAYQGIDWPVIMLLGAMIPVGQAMEATGGAQAVADALLLISGNFPAVVTLTILLVATMFLSDLINNAAAAVLMAPIAVNLATAMEAAPDGFLMAVAVGASCAFLTPIGHQSNTLVLGPGGYKFSDYFRLGFPLEIVIVVVSVPLILYFWPLFPPAAG